MNYHIWGPIDMIDTDDDGYENTVNTIIIISIFFNSL